ncbi:HNH endonuclease [Pseudomonas putida]|uniref:HNH endonuclease n=1 Tax=Pseudomonas putida TaxID=303 RepID=UPI002447C56B|nr:HNH endonuclease [Pseudomonas putida]MDG9817164.1 HNH endonuclease [Pseudomonas putida]
MITPSTPTPNTNRPLASERLKQGSIYTRKDLSAIYDIKDASINNGIFRLKEYDSVWLFITEHKTSDRTPYVDSLEGDTLHMQGQRLGRTDALIKDHRLRGLELLVFYRKAKYEHPFAGFRYEGIFNYHSHTGSTPTSFVLNRSQATADEDFSREIGRQLDNQGDFNPNDLRDARTRVLSSIVRRRGQPQFRKQLLEAYQGRCAVTACPLQQVLEAAHIHPYLGAETNVVSNGLLLRTDLHTLFDLGLWWINPVSLRIEISEVLMGGEYGSIEGRSLALPKNESEHPSRAALEFRRSAIANR